MISAYQEHRFLAQDGTSLYYREYGAFNHHRPTILCLCGLARNSKDYDRIAIRLSDMGFHVLAPDYRGRGRSDYCDESDKYNPSTYLDDIRHLLTVTNIHQVIVMGTSLGGLLAMGMGAALPSILKAVILNDVGPDIKPGGLDRILNYLSKRPVFRSWEDANTHIKATFPQVNYKNEEDWDWLTRNSCCEHSDGTITYDWDPKIVEPLKKGSNLPDLWALYGTLGRLPLLAFRGELSDILTEETFARMKERHNTIQTVTVPDVGHVPTLEEPVCQEALDEFLSPFR